MSLPRAWLDALERDSSLDEPERLRERADVLDRLEAYFPEGLDAAPAEVGLHHRAMAMRARLEAINRQLHAELRQDLRCGRGRERLLRWASVENAPMHDEGYDYLDELLAGVLSLERPDEVAEPAAEMVFYQPTPARHIFDLIERAVLTAGDVLVDLGSGLGHVPLLVALCTEARAIGIEREAAYIARARQCAETLNLANVDFIHQDARAADFSIGTVFYLYTPFTGSILRTVLDALRREASHRGIRVCTYGPCTPVIANEPWLMATGPLETNRVAAFRSHR
jgi:hypothetical protein